MDTIIDRLKTLENRNGQQQMTDLKGIVAELRQKTADQEKRIARLEQVVIELVNKLATLIS